MQGLLSAFSIGARQLFIPAQRSFLPQPAPVREERKGERVSLCCPDSLGQDDAQRRHVGRFRRTQHNCGGVQITDDTADARRMGPALHGDRAVGNGDGGALAHGVPKSFIDASGGYTGAVGLFDTGREGKDHDARISALRHRCATLRHRHGLRAVAR